MELLLPPTSKSSQQLLAKLFLHHFNLTFWPGQGLSSQPSQTQNNHKPPPTTLHLSLPFIPSQTPLRSPQIQAWHTPHPHTQRPYGPSVYV